MSAINTNNINYIETKCFNCGKPIIKYKYNKGNSFCPKPSYCRYDYLHKIRDPKSHSIMSKINDPDFYYLIGLICTDGNITYPHNEKKNIGYSCYINLNKKDKSLINSIQFKFGGKAQLMHDNTIRWWITNKNFIDFLKNIGITHNKSHTLDIKKWFNNLNEYNKINVLRGIIDGDGSIKMYKKDKVFNICTGSAVFHNMIKDYLIEKFTQKGLHEEHKQTYSYIKYTNIMMLNILDKIYQNVPNILYMKRKYDEYLKIKKYYKNSNGLKDYRYKNEYN